MCSRKINNKKNSVVQKKDTSNHVINKNIRKIDDQRRKLLILREKGIENYKAFKKSYTSKNNGLTVIEISPKENIQDSEMIQGETKKSLSMIKARNIMIGQIKLCRLTGIKRKLNTKKEF